MKICHSGDLHLDEHSRFEETCRVMEWMEGDICEFKPNLILIGGDSAPVSVRRMTPKERNKLGEWYQDLAQTAPVVVIPGNHDADPEDVAIFRELRSVQPIRVLSRPGVVVGPQYCVYGIPFPSKGFLMEAVQGQSVEDVGQACRDALKMILMGAKVEFAKHPDLFHIILGHLNVSGSDVGGFALVGQDVEVSAEDLVATGADLICLSHIHKRQSWHGKVFYPGSPRYVDFGEEGEPRGYNRYTLEKGKEPVVEFRPTQGLTPLQTIKIVYNDAFVDVIGHCQDGAEVRVLVECSEAQRPMIDEAVLRKSILADKAKSVKFEWRVNPTERVRVPAMREARTDADRLKAYLGTLQPVPEPETVERLLVKLSTLA